MAMGHQYGKAGDLGGTGRRTRFDCRGCDYA